MKGCLPWKSPDAERGARRRRRRPTHCKRGHPFDKQNTITRGNGAIVCRTCRTAYDLARKQRALEARNA